MELVVYEFSLLELNFSLMNSLKSENRYIKRRIPKMMRNKGEYVQWSLILKLSFTKAYVNFCITDT